MVSKAKTEEKEKKEVTETETETKKDVKKTTKKTAKTTTKKSKETKENTTDTKETKTKAPRKSRAKKEVKKDEKQGVNTVSPNNKEIVLTREGMNKIENELDQLRTVKRKEVAARIKEAISHGDLSENSEYEEAKNEQAFMEGRIAKLEKVLRNARLIRPEEINHDAVSLGANIKLQDIEKGRVLDITLVGTAEADPVEKRISDESPVGKAILGRSEGEEVDVIAPAGIVKYKILEVKYDNHPLA